MVPVNLKKLEPLNNTKSHENPRTGPRAPESCIFNKYMAWIKIKDQIVNSKSIQRMQYLPPGEGGMDRHTLNVFLDSGES